MTTVNPSDLSATFSAIGSSSTANSGLAYGNNNFMSSELKTQIQNVLASRLLLLGALSENETANNSYAILTLNLTVYFKIPAQNLTFYARNDLNGGAGGHIGVGVNASPIPYSSPKTFTAVETQTINLAAYDTNNVNNYTWLFNNTEAPLNISEWKKDLFQIITPMGYTQSLSLQANKNDGGDL